MGQVGEVDDSNPREAMRARMQIAQNKVADHYDTEVRRKEGREVIGGGMGIDTPRGQAAGLTMLQAAPIGLKSHLNNSGIQGSRTETGLSLLSRQETRPKNDPKTYVPLRGDAFKERMARQHEKMIRTFGYEPPAEKEVIKHKKDFSHMRRASLMTRGTKRKLKRVDAEMKMLMRAGNGWEVNWRTRKSALEHIEKEGNAALIHIDLICRKLKDPDWGVRAAAADVIANMGESCEPYAEHIINILEDVNPTVRSSALKCLPKLGGDVARLHWKKVVHALEHDDSDRVRNTAFEVIREMCMIKPGAEREAREKVEREAAEAMKEAELKAKLDALRGGKGKKGSPGGKKPWMKDAQRAALSLVTSKGRDGSMSQSGSPAPSPAPRSQSSLAP